MNSLVQNRAAIHLKTSTSEEQAEGTEQELQYPYYLRDIRSKRNKNFYRQCFVLFCFVFATLRSRRTLEDGVQDTSLEIGLQLQPC